MNPVAQEEHGFSIYHDVFRPDAMSRILHALDSLVVARSKAGARHLLQVPEVRALATDYRLTEIAQRYVGPAAFPFRATLFDKSAAKNWLVAWHQDTALPLRARVTHPQWGPWTTKGGVLHAIAPASALQSIVALRVHLNDSTDANGPLRVLPGTHARGVLDNESIRELAAAIAPIECTTNSGGVVAMRPLLVHASSKVRVDRPRRVLHIEYAASRHFGLDIELAVG